MYFLRVLGVPPVARGAGELVEAGKGGTPSVVRSLVVGVTGVTVVGGELGGWPIRASFSPSGSGGGSGGDEASLSKGSAFGVEAVTSLGFVWVGVH